MTQDTSTYYVWIGGSCDYGHKERAGGAAVVIELMEQREQRCKLACNLCRVAREEGESQLRLDHSMHRGKEKAQLCWCQDCAISQKPIADRNPR